MSALRLDFVSKVYSSGGRDVAALHNLSLTVHEGECVAVIGESGSGKSTLARLVMGLEQPTSGSVLVNGQRPSDVARKGVAGGSAIVLQDPTDAVDPRMSVEQIVAEPLRVGGLRMARSAIRERVVASLREVGLDESVLARRPNQLSGGQQQRVGIARALVRDPGFLVLDEPTSALDTSVQGQVMRLIENLRSRLGIASLLITHDLAVAAYLADRIVVLRHGRIVETGPSEAVWRSPRHPYTIALLEAASYQAVIDTPLDVESSADARACLFYDVCRGRGAHPCSGTTGEEMVEVAPRHEVAENCTLRSGVHAV